MIWRGIQILFAISVAASAVEMIDRSGLGGDDSPIAPTAETLRTLGAGDLPPQWSAGITSRLEPIRSLATSFDAATKALEG